MNSKWQANKIGLVDFWYYDIEEFYFSEGKMLLRGANGSGKSVTMQSFIPLLLDGNMRPERLDPFGSRARRMENYLLEENDEREERTGYLYMEFKRKESDTYLTIGMGMRARKNKKLETWYFVLTDGRRVNKDFQLYKEVGSRIVLTKRELRNRIGEGGQVYDLQNEYMVAVNKYIFGFDTLDEYKEMIDLLIQLRTPKLSKDFKPSVINEILSSSLQMLSEDDLRPMSEAIENMDGLKTNVDTLKNCIESVQKINRVYERYNKVVLLDKAKLLRKESEEYKRQAEKARRTESELKETTALAESTEQSCLDNRAENKQRQEELESLGASDVTALKQKELDTAAEQIGVQRSLGQKDDQIEEKEEKWKEYQTNVKDQENQADVLRDKLDEAMAEMGEIAEEVSFDEHAFLETELKAQVQERYAFETHKTLLKRRLDIVEQAVEELQLLKQKQIYFDEQMQQLDQTKEKRDKEERELLQYENQFSEVKNELIEQIYGWEQNNRELKIEKELLQGIASQVEQFGVQSDYGGLKDQIRKAKAGIEREYRNALWEVEKAEDIKAQELKAKEDELRQWEEKEDPEPEISEEVYRSRQMLRKKGIPFIQFYKAIDFAKNIEAKRRNDLEEALYRMGVLDALIVSADYRQEIRHMDPGMCDRYIFSDMEHVREGLSTLLEIDNTENDILFYQQVSGALSTLGYEGTHHTTIHADGTYQIGALTGTITKDYQSKYIGVRARADYREKQILRLHQEWEELKKEREELQAHMALWQSKLKMLDRELEAFPSGEDLKLALNQQTNARQEVERIQRIVSEMEQQVQEVLTALNKIKKKAHELCGEAYLPMSLDRCNEIRGMLREYQGMLTDLELGHNAYLETVQRTKDIKEHMEEIDADLENLRYDQGNLQRTLRELENSLESIRQQLQLTNYEEIKERIDFCAKRIQELPQEYEVLIRTKSDAEAKIEQLRSQQMQIEIQLGKTRQKKQLLGDAFLSEWKLGYVEAFAVEMQAEELADQVISNLRDETELKNKLSLQENLQNVYHENRAQLVEYQLTMEHLFTEAITGSDMEELWENDMQQQTFSRIDIVARYAGTKVKFGQLFEKLQQDVMEQETLLRDKDRELFEDILANTISKKIRAKIQASNAWVMKMNDLMGSMKTSSGLTLSLKWRSKSAEHEEQLGTHELVELLKKDSEIMREDEVEKLSRHFRSKIDEARKLLEQGSQERSFHAIMREVLDYRKWFEFQLECRKTGENKKELTDRVFFTFSGGEKAMAMYVPLFSAVVAKYQSANMDAPRLISLDEAFAGVDETNIKDMFRLMVGFEFDFMLNSQILYGDYETVPQLAIYQLVRPENAKYVSVIRYHWNGKVRALVQPAGNN